MGYGYYEIRGADGKERPCGYLVLATCDQRGCHGEIDHGMGYLCGTVPHDPFSDEPGCGRYYCADHLGWVGPRGGCSHSNRWHVGYGSVLSCMELSPSGWVVCCDRKGHAEPHAWDEP